MPKPTASIGTVLPPQYLAALNGSSTATELLLQAGDGTTDTQRRERRLQSASLFDSIREDLGSLQLSLSTADRARLDDYLQEVREIERRV